MLFVTGLTLEEFVANLKKEAEEKQEQDQEQGGGEEKSEKSSLTLSMSMSFSLSVLDESTIVGGDEESDLSVIEGGGVGGGGGGGGGGRRVGARRLRAHGQTGLRNLGNTCFMNSVLQALDNTGFYLIIISKMPKICILNRIFPQQQQQKKTDIFRDFFVEDLVPQSGPPIPLAGMSGDNWRRQTMDCMMLAQTRGKSQVFLFFPLFYLIFWWFYSNNFPAKKC